MHFKNVSFEIFETGAFIWEKAQSANKWLRIPKSLFSFATPQLHADLDQMVEASGPKVFGKVPFVTFWPAISENIGDIHRVAN